MDKLSRNNRLSPTLAISAVKGDISLLDMVKPTDTIIYDQNNLMILVFTRDSVLELSMDDFSVKGPLDLMTATFETDSLDLGISDILDRISGDFRISSPSLTLHYANSFIAPLELSLNFTGKRGKESVDLDPVEILLTSPEMPGQVVRDSYTIDKTNSTLPDFVSLPPEVVYFSGFATLNPSAGKSDQPLNELAADMFVGSVELDIPMEFRMNNLQFSDTTDNFLKSDNGDDSSIKPEDIKFLRIDVNAINGFPLGASLSMSLFNSESNTVIKTVDATDLLAPAAVDSNGKATTATETSTTIEFTQDFFKSVDDADMIIFTFTMTTTDGGTRDVKIYSDYRINFKAALVIKPDIN